MGCVSGKLNAPAQKGCKHGCNHHHHHQPANLNDQAAANVVPTVEQAAGSVPDVPKVAAPKETEPLATAPEQVEPVITVRTEPVATAFKQEVVAAHPAEAPIILDPLSVLQQAQYSPSATHGIFWKHLFEIFSIPRPSCDYDGNMKAERLEGIRSYVRTVGERLGGTVKEDVAGNLYLRVYRRNSDSPDSLFSGSVSLVSPAELVEGELTIPVDIQPRPNALICFQGHMDVVCAENSGVVHDFETEGVEVVLIEGGNFKDDEIICPCSIGSGLAPLVGVEPLWLKAKKEITLGADNGVAIACALAVMETWAKRVKYSDPTSLELLLTVDEETSFRGAEEVDSTFVTADRLLNLDSEEDGRVCVGSAGGVELEFSFTEYAYDSIANNIVFNAVEKALKVPEPVIPTKSIIVKLSGLKGGHSGIDIGRDRPSACQVIRELLNAVNWEAKLIDQSPSPRKSLVRSLSSVLSPRASIQAMPEPPELCHLSVGSMPNVIAREGEFILRGSAETLKIAKARILGKWANLGGQVQTKDSIDIGDDSIANLTIFTETEAVLDISEIEESGENNSLKVKRVCDILAVAQHGVLDRTVEGSVKSSVNLSKILLLKNSELICHFFWRSTDSEDLKKFPGLQQEAFASVGSFTVSAPLNFFPAWMPSKGDFFSLVSKLCPSGEATSYSVHAGLECGLLLDKLGKKECVSIGPTIRGAHSPGERLAVESCVRWVEWVSKITQALE